MRTLDVPPVSITILEGDITARPVDAIVNAANNALWMGSGVAGAIKARGGPTIERDAVAQGPIAVGESVLTSGGALPARHVIHAAAMGQDLIADAGTIEKATSSALALANAHGFSSIAFPALGTGVGGFPIDECARIMVGAVLNHLLEGTSLRLVEFVLFGYGAYDQFASAVERIRHS